MNVGFVQVIVVVALVVLLFGGKRLGKLGGELGRGIRSLRKGLSGAESHSASDPTWVHSAVDVAKTAQRVRKATRLPRRFPFG